MAEMKVEIISMETIRPSSPTPENLKTFNICLLDELAPPSYVPILLFYSSAEFAPDQCNAIAEKLKESLSKTLTRFYPFCGKLRGNLSMECNDEGALFVEARVKNVAFSDIIKNPETSWLYQLFPFDPYNVQSEEKAMTTGVQVSLFDCGSVAIGLCLSHKIADGATVASFLNAWSATATGLDETLAPRLDSASLFPPRGIDLLKQGDIRRNEKIVTKRFEFSGTKLAGLKAKVAEGNPTRIEAVTALIWKAAMEATKANLGRDTFPPSIATHLVNIRGRMEPTLPDHSVGNLWRLSVSPYKNEKKEVDLRELTSLLRKSIRRVDKDYVAELRRDGLAKAVEPLKELKALAGGGGVEVYTFSSWVKFPLYEVDFGWGKPVRVCTITVQIRNCVILMGMKSGGDGIEAWVNLTEEDMAKFECNQELLEFVSASS